MEGGGFMIIGIPKEVKIRESRVACTPAGVRYLSDAGHRILVQNGAGEGSGFSDTAFRKAGAEVLPSAEKVWLADMIVKVKEPVASEYGYLCRDQVLFTFLHLAADPKLARHLVEKGVSAIAYETVVENGRLPLLVPMSEIAGRMSVMAGGFYLANHLGGNGTLLSGVPGVMPGKVTILGGGTAGMNAAMIAKGIGARVTILELDQEKMRYLGTVLGPQVQTLFSTRQHIVEELEDTDLLVGAVLVPGAAAPRLLDREMLRSMKRGAVFVDISIDQGGCSETSRPTSHEDPVYSEEGVLHYCVTNMPGAYAKTSTEALTGNTLPYVKAIADMGVEKAVGAMPGLQAGLNTYKGVVTHKAVAASLGAEYGGVSGTVS